MIHNKKFENISKDYWDYNPSTLSLLALINFPHKKNSNLIERLMGDKKQNKVINWYKRKYRFNNGFEGTLVVTTSDVPYGITPKRILSYIILQVKLTKNRQINLNLENKDFVDKIIAKCDSKDISKIKNIIQSLSISNLNFKIRYAKHISDNETEVTERIEKLYLIDSIDTTESILDNYIKGCLWNSIITVSIDFYNLIISPDFPVEEKVLLNLETSMALDVYYFFLYFNSVLQNASVEYNWQDLQHLFSFGYGEDRFAMKTFKTEFKQAIKNVLQLCDLKIEPMGDSGYRFISNI